MNRMRHNIRSYFLYSSFFATMSISKREIILCNNNRFSECAYPRMFAGTEDSSTLIIIFRWTIFRVQRAIHINFRFYLFDWIETRKLCTFEPILIKLYQNYSVSRDTDRNHKEVNTHQNLISLEMFHGVVANWNWTFHFESRDDSCTFIQSKFSNNNKLKLVSIPFANE